MTANYTKIRNCACCKHTQTEIVLNLEPTPMEDQFLTEPFEQPTFPLDLALCQKCGFAFLPYHISPDLSYSKYLYNTKVTVGLVNHYQEYAQSLVKRLKLGKSSFAVDLGSNDGTMVAALTLAGLTTLGVEPASDIAATANKAGRKTVCNYFSSELGVQLAREHGRASLITANYMFANIPDLDDFMVGISALLDQHGVFVIQTGYHPDQFKMLMFDYIYHEHFSYFSILSLQALFARHNMELIDAEKQSPKGGSIRVYAAKKGIRDTNHKVIEELIRKEESEGWRLPLPFKELKEKLDSRKQALHEKINHFKSEGYKVIGFGASHSTTTLIYEFELGGDIDFIVDDNILKHGTYSPGLHIPVYSPNHLKTDEKLAVIILAWQHKDSILNRYQIKGNKSRVFISPI